MPEPVIVAIISACGVLGAAALAWLTAAQARTRRRIAAAETTNHALWAYTKLLVDHIYRGRGAPPPDPPDYLKHIFDPRSTL